MADEASRPLLGEVHQESHYQTASIIQHHHSFEISSESTPLHEGSHHQSQTSSIGQRRQSFELSSESTPLLHRRDETNVSTYGGTEPPRALSPASETLSPDDNPKKLRRKFGWTVVCGLLAIGAIVVILVLAFIAPEVVKQYTKRAVVFNPTNLSVESATNDGVRARLQGDVFLDAKRVESGSVRNFGRFVTWIGREVETSRSKVDVYLPEYENTLVGTASLPAIKLNIRNGHVNHLDFEADLVAGNVEGLRSIAVDWLDGKLERLLLQGSASLHLKSGLLSLGEQTLTDSIIFEGMFLTWFRLLSHLTPYLGDDFPSVREVNITEFNVHDVDSPDDEGAMAVNASVLALIDSPFSLRIPPLGFKVLIANCSPRDAYIPTADVVTKEIAVTPGHSAVIDVSGIIRGLPDELTTNCPGEKRSPLDSLLTSYIHGSQTIIYVRGADVPSLGTPKWMTEILQTVTVPLPFTGHNLDNLVQNFSMSNVHFSLPNPMAEPDTPESLPTVSALVKVLIAIPKGLDFELDVPRVRAKADVYYHKNKLGVLDLKEWQPANSTLISDVDNSTVLQVKFAMDNAPLEVTDDDVLADVLSSLIFEGRPVELSVSASVDAELATVLGQVAVRGIPADGKFAVKRKSHHILHSILLILV